MALPTPGVTPANWGAQLNAEIASKQAQPYSVTGGWVVASGATTNPFSGVATCRLSPLSAVAGMTVDQVGYDPQSGVAGDFMRLGIYLRTAINTFTLVTDLGTVDISTTGLKAISYSFTVDRDHYYAQQLEGSTNTGMGCVTNPGGPVTPVGTAGSTNVNLSGGLIVTGGVTVSGSLLGSLTTCLDDDDAPRYFLRRA